MTTNVSSVTSHFPKPQPGFTTTTSGPVSSAATTVGLNSTGSYSNGDIVVLMIDPADSDKKQVFVGTIDVSGSQVTGVIWVDGTNQSHVSGATVVDYVTAAHIQMMTKGFLEQHKQDGTHADTITTDNINENTLANGVTVDGVNLKDGTINTSGAVGNVAVIASMPVQVASVAYNDVSTGTGTIPLDNTIPQNTEGDEYMTLSITPKSSTNILVIEAVSYAANSAGSNTIAAPLFQDSTADALATGATFAATANARYLITTKHRMVAGTTSSTTFKIRIGASSASTTTFNGAAATREYGTTTKSSITITEYKAS